MRHWLSVFWLMILSVFAFPKPDFETIQPLNNGYLVQGGQVFAFKVEVSSDTTEALTKLTLTCEYGDTTADGSSNDKKVFGESNGVITNIQLFTSDSDGEEILPSNTIDAQNNSTATFTGSLQLDTNKQPIFFKVFVANHATINAELNFKITEYEAGSTNYQATSTDFDSNLNEGVTLNVVGVFPTFNPVSETQIVFDEDLTNKQVLNFTLKPSVKEDYILTKIIVKNTAANFDIDQTGAGVTNLKLWRSHDSSWNDADTVLAQISDSTVSFNSRTEAVITLPDAGGVNTLQKNVAHQFFLTVDIGVSTNILENPLDLSSNPTEVNAKIESMSGKGHNSNYAYGPIAANSNFTTNNAFNGKLAGLVIGSVTSIFPSMNAAAGLTNVPMVSVVVKSIGVATNLHTLGIVNTDQTFDANSNDTGVKNLHLIKDTGGGEYNGYGFSRDNKIDATFSISDAANAKLVKHGNDDLTIGNGMSATFYVLADFGSNMRTGAGVSLNISAETRVSADVNNDGDFTNDTGYGNLTVGRSLPVLLENASNIELVEPELVLHSEFAFQTKTNKPDGLYCDTDSNLDCSDGGGATKRLVAGMENVRMHAVTVDVGVDMQGVSFEFESPNAYFSEESTGISAIWLYLDKNLDGQLSDTDIYLGGTRRFSPFGRRATVSEVSLPRGKNQRVLVLFDIGQRATNTDDQLSFRLKRVFSTNHVVVGVFPNPIAPYKYKVAKHQLKISELKTIGMPNTNVITPSESFDIQASLKPLSMNELKIKLENSVPWSIPKFYYGGKDGADRSYEFTVFFNSNQSSTNLGNPFNYTEEKTLFYNANPVNAVSEGDYTIDMDVFYEMSDTNVGGEFFDHPIRLSRSKGAGTNYKSAVELGEGNGLDITPALASTNPMYSWSLPAYVQAVTYRVNNKDEVFKNYESIPQGTSISIMFKNSGRDIDPGSISLTLNGAFVKAENQMQVDSSDIYYTYDATTGTLTLQSVGTESGTLMLSASDSFGIPYPQAPFIFYTSTELQLEKVLIYPNPYSPSVSGDGLSFGFSLTQSAMVSFKIYDSMGRELIMLKPEFYSMGYHVRQWNAMLNSSKKFMASGTYYIKFIAEGLDGTKRVATTKLAVY